MSSKRWCFTTWAKPKFNKFELCDFLIYQSEECTKTGRLHFQGYIEFKKEYALYQVKSLFKEKGMYVDAAKESREHNILYCSKAKTYKGYRLSYIENAFKVEDKSQEDWDDFDEMFDLNTKVPVNSPTNCPY